MRLVNLFLFSFFQKRFSKMAKNSKQKKYFQNFKINFEKSENTDESSYQPIIGSILPKTDYPMTILLLKL